MLIIEYVYKRPAFILTVGGLIGTCLLYAVELVSGLDIFNWVSLTILYIIIINLAGSLIKSLYQSAYTDSLTELWNRRYFEMRLLEEAQRLNRTGSPLCIAFIDTDGFKNVNDSYGHITGDKLLQKIAGIIERNIRQFDIPVRWGGDEFAIIFPDTKINGAFIVAERIRKSVERSKSCFFYSTLSIGIVQVDQRAELEQVFAMADKALYKAKQSKNAIHVVLCNENVFVQCS